MRDNAYFGEPWNLTVATEMEQTPTPLATPCLFCHEPIQDGDRGLMIGDGHDGQNPLHRECWVRVVFGSIVHQKRTCRCYGGTERDEPDGLTLRQAARAAAQHWERQQRGAGGGDDTVLEGDTD